MQKSFCFNGQNHRFSGTLFDTLGYYLLDPVSSSFVTSLIHCWRISSTSVTDSGVVTINQHTKNRVTAYLDAAGHGYDLDGPLFRPVRTNQYTQEARRHLNDKPTRRARGC